MYTISKAFPRVVLLWGAIAVGVVSAEQQAPDPKELPVEEEPRPRCRMIMHPGISDLGHCCYVFGDAIHR